MARLKWNNFSDITFRSGIKKGVLYLDDRRAIPWDGLVSVHKVESNEARYSYLDGIKYYNNVPYSDYKARIEALTYPIEFECYLGYHTSGNGLYIGGQRKRSFSFSYQTDVLNRDGEVQGVELHLIYNAMVTNDDLIYRTTTQQTQVEVMSWDVETKPTFVEGLGYSAHYIIRSNELDREHLDYVEDVLYGSESSDPYLPEPTFLYDVFTGYTGEGYGYKGYGLLEYGG